MIKNKIFKYFITFLFGISCIFIGYENPLLIETPKKYVKFINSQDIVQQIKSFIGKNLIGNIVKTIDIDVDEVDILGATDIIIGNTNSDYIKS